MTTPHHRLYNVPLCALFIALTALTNFALAQTEKLTVNFDYDKHTLTDETKATLDQTCARVLTLNLLQITLSGHTDADGTEGYNNTLAENRARAVYNYLISKGIPANKIIVASWGEGKPVANNGSENGKHQNRRVDLLIQTEAPKPQAQAEVIKPKPVVTDIHRQLAKPSQFFKVSAKSEITITGNEGTVLTFPITSLVNSRGQVVTDSVTIELKEFYKMEDILAAKLNTTSNGNVLVSGGMIYVNAKADNEELHLRNGTEVHITFKDAPANEGMQTFNGVPDTAGNLNWVPYTRTALTEQYLANQQSAIPPVAVSSNPPTKMRKRDKVNVNVKGFMWWASDGKETSDMAAVPVEKTSATDQLVLTSAQLQWINCDRFYEVKDKSTLTVTVGNDLQPAVYLVFKDIKAVMTGRSNEKGEVTFDNVPLNHRVTIIAMSMADSEAYYAEREMTIKGNEFESMNLFRTSVEEVKKELAALN